MEKLMKYVVNKIWIKRGNGVDPKGEQASRYGFQCPRFHSRHIFHENFPLKRLDRLTRESQFVLREKHQILIRHDTTMASENTSWKFNHFSLDFLWRYFILKKFFLLIFTAAKNESRIQKVLYSFLTMHMRCSHLRSSHFEWHETHCSC